MTSYYSELFLFIYFIVFQLVTKTFHYENSSSYFSNRHIGINRLCMGYRNQHYISLIPLAIEEPLNPPFLSLRH